VLPFPNSTSAWSRASKKSRNARMGKLDERPRSQQETEAAGAGVPQGTNFKARSTTGSSQIRLGSLSSRSQSRKCDTSVRVEARAKNIASGAIARLLRRSIYIYMLLLLSAVVLMLHYCGCVSSKGRISRSYIPLLPAGERVLCELLRASL
jgi:hypothetical protein